MTRAALAWRVYAIVALALALLGIGHWSWAITLAGPVMYGEGAVAHAAQLARYGLEYAAGGRLGGVADAAPIFTAANYPPLYFHLASFGDPFITGRVVSILATIFVAAAIAWRARRASPFIAVTLALAWLGSVPVLQWAPALKPDLVALGLTVAAVVLLERERPRTVASGALLALAVLAKPTALLPAAAMLVFMLRRGPAAALRGLGAGIAVIVVALIAFPDLATKIAWVHIVSWNALGYRLDLLAPLVLLALVVLAVPITAILLTRPSTTVVTAYAVGAVGILLLGGREGATINYFLDLSAALALAVAGRAPRLATSIAYPIASIGAAAVALFLFNPFVVIPGRAVGPGGWGDPGRAAVVASIPGTLLVEDSGLLVASGREPLVDDLFLWSRNHAREAAGGLSFLEGDRLLEEVQRATFDAVVSEVELERVTQVGGYEAQRWHPELVTAVLARYELGRRVYGLCPPFQTCQQLYVYVRR